MLVLWCATTSYAPDEAGEVQEGADLAGGPPSARRQQNRWGEGTLLRSEIVDAARRLLERDGTEAAVTLRGVAREAGITAPSIYAHFADREELIESVIAAVADEATQALEQALSALGDDASPRAQLRTYCDVYITFAHQRPASYQVLYVRPNPSAMPDVRETMMAVNRAFESLISATAPQLGSAEVSMRATLMWAALHGLAALPPHHPRYPWPQQGVLVEELLDLYLESGVLTL
jgi:AcrR family transcriptional regulator